MTTALSTKPTDEALMASQLSDQYAKAVAGLIEQIKFGAMMLALQKSFGSTRGPGNINNLQKRGDGLKPWLTSNCPEISHPTAFRWMNLARIVKDEYQLGEKTDLVSILEGSADLSEKHAKIAEKVRAFITGKSQRQLLLDFRAGVGELKRLGGARGHEPDTRTDAQKRAEFIEAMRRDLGEFLGQVDKYISQRASWKELARGEIVALQGCLENALDNVKDHLRNLHR